MDNAAIDVVHAGKGYGPVALKLLNGGFKNLSSLRTLDVLRKEEWLQFDQVIEREALRRLRGIQDLMTQGLEYNMRSVGLAKTVLQWETSSDFGAAEITMDGITRAAQDKVLLDHSNLLPLFITHKDVEFSAREVAAMRQMGEPLDTMNVQMAARKVAESLEALLFQGPTTALQLPTVWGNAKAYGYITAPNRVTGSLAHKWTDVGSTPATIFADVLAMKQAAIGQRFFGPYILYVPTVYETILDKDYSIVSNVVTDTIRERILKIGGINDVRVADFLPGGGGADSAGALDNVLLIQMTPEVVDLVVSQDPIILPWETEGGMRLHFKVLACMVPRMKSTQNPRSGLIHYTHA